jgi:hypothetical protein
MKNKRVLFGLIMAIAAVTTCGTAQAQIGGQQAMGSSSMSAGGPGLYGQTDYLITGKQANQLYDQQQQNYTSPQISDPGLSDHSANQEPIVRQMMMGDSHGLAATSTAPMATNTNTIGHQAFPSGQFSYGFSGKGPAPYHGSYAQGNPNTMYGGILPSVSTGSVDINTVDNSGIGFAASPLSQMQSPNSMPNIQIQIPGAAASTLNTLNWLQNSFFGP